MGLGSPQIVPGHIVSHLYNVRKWQCKYRGQVPRVLHRVPIVLLLGKVQSGYDYVGSLKGKAILMQAWTPPEGCMKLRLPIGLWRRQVGQAYALVAFTRRYTFLLWAW